MNPESDPPVGEGQNVTPLRSNMFNGKASVKKVSLGGKSKQQTKSAEEIVEEARIERIRRAREAKEQRAATIIQV